MSDFNTRILTSLRTSEPLEMGFNKNIGGRPGVSLTNPIPRSNVITVPIPNLKTTSSFDDVLTRSSVPTVSGLGTQNQLITAIPTQCPSCGQEIEKEPEATIEEIEKEPFNNNPQGLTDQEMNEFLLEILTSNNPEIACACNAWDYYPVTNPLDGEFKWKGDAEVIYRDSESNEWKNSKELKVKYSRWIPIDNDESAKILFLHDALDNRKSWWCAQKLLSSFFDTISVDLIGSGESTLPRGINIPDRFGKSTEAKFPWSFKTHAKYLIDMAKVVWPGQKFYVVGTGWGAQIGASMASLSNNVAGVIMTNPPGFSKDNYFQFIEFYEMGKFKSDEDLRSMHGSFISKVRDSIILGLSSSDNGHSGRDNASSTTLKLILNQYLNFDRRRILIDQVMAMMNTPLQEFPKTKSNQDGLEVDKISVPVLVVSGGNDIFYPPEHRSLYAPVYYKSDVSTSYIPNSGHFAHIEHPKILAELILNFITEKEGYSILNDSFIGFVGSSQGNEKTMISGLRTLYLSDKI